MSQKKQTSTTQTNTYDPSSMNAFKGFTSQVGGYTGQWLGADGTTAANKTPGFNLMYQSALNNANAMNARNVRNIGSNALALGSNPNSAATQAILARAGRASTNTQASAYMNSYQNALNQQTSAAQMAAAYKPLQTGGTQNTTETTGGLGSWLPQIAGMGLSAAMGFMKPGQGAPASSPIGGAGSAIPGNSGGYGGGIGVDPNASYFGSNYR
jgi:hypothetical protein